MSAPPLLPGPPAAAVPARASADLDTRIHLVEQRPVARDPRRRTRVQDLRQRIGRAVAPRALLLKLGGLAAAGGGLAWAWRRGCEGAEAPGTHAGNHAGVAPLPASHPLAAGRSRVAGIPDGLALRQIWPLAREAVASWIDDDAPSMGAALAYYTVFSVAPLLLIVIAVAGLVFGREAARGEIMGQLSDLLGNDSARAVERLLDSVNQPGAGVLATVTGVAVLLVGATTVFAELQSALDRIWRAPERPPGQGLWGLLRTRLLSLGMVMGLGFLLMVSLVVSAGLSALGKWWTPWFSQGAVLLLELLNLVVSLLLMSAVFAMIYKWMPRVRVAWRDVWVGALITALLFTLGKSLIGLYIGRSGVASAFGAAASLVVVLVWVYWSAQIFLLGAEFTWVWSNRRGSRRGRHGHGPLPPARLGGQPRTDAARPADP